MIEQRLPVIARWMLYALGSVEGKRIHRPLDPVAAWLLKAHPGLLPTVPQAALLTTIRARTEVVDRLLNDEFDRARQRGEKVAVWTLGGGFDARWFRYLPLHTDVIAARREVESPALLELKGRLLIDSPYVEGWRQVEQVGLPEDHWSIQPLDGATPIVLFETGAGRLDDARLRNTLLAIRRATPNARIVLGLPAITDKEKRWAPRQLAELGWRVWDDLHYSNRGRLMSQNGQELCPGMYAFRVVRLAAREPLRG